MRRSLLLLALAATLPLTTQAQWTMQDSRTTADLRGIDNVGGGVAWASGTDGTILRTEDAGFVWQLCAKPPGGEHLDFRAIQASDNNTAIAMSSGKGDLSRLYKTTDGCQTWKLLFTNPDPDGFWDALVTTKSSGLLIGDPVAGRFEIYGSEDPGLNLWQRIGEESSINKFRFDLSAYPGEELFAASNSVLRGSPQNGILFVSGGELGAKFSLAAWKDRSYMSFKSAIPLAKGSTSGAFSFAAARQSLTGFGRLVAVGGNYEDPSQAQGTAAWSKDGGKHWTAAKTPPHGYRSAVAYDSKSKTWITVGPNGTDISTDDGRDWRALHPDPAFHEPPDADQHWNALSLPFVVGPHGRIATLRPSALASKPTGPADRP